MITRHIEVHSELFLAHIYEPSLMSIGRIVGSQLGYENSNDVNQEN